MIVSGWERIQSAGIKYSNIVPLQEKSRRSPQYDVNDLPRRNQASWFTSPLAALMKTAVRASDANRS